MYKRRFLLLLKHTQKRRNNMKAIHGTFISTNSAMEMVQKVKDKHIAKLAPNAVTREQLTPEALAVYEALTEVHHQLFNADNKSQRM
jgi:hypothetical protein